MTALRKVTKKWTTSDSARIRICDMTDDHLLNTIAWCQREHRKAQDIPYPSFSGEEAQYQAERDYESFMASEPDRSFPLYEDLCEEAYRRKLTLPESGRVSVPSSAPRSRRR